MKTIVTSLLASVALTLGAASSVQAADDTVLIGIMVPVTGSEATYGKDMYNAAKVAAKEINDAGGVDGKKIKLTVGDAACDPQQAVNAASSLSSKDVDGVVGGYCSGATVPTLKKYGDNNIPFIIAAANSTEIIPANKGNAFMINSTGDDQAKTAVDFFESRDIKSLAIVNQGDAYSQNLAKLTRKLWESQDHKTALFATTSKGEQDYNSLVQRIRSSKADAVFWTAYYADGGLLIRQLRHNGYQGLIAVGDGSSSPKLFEIAGSSAEGVVNFAPPTADFIPAAKDFIATYKERFKDAPGPYSALAYDGVKLMADAMQRAGSLDHDAVIKALADTKDYEGLAGTINFTKDHTLSGSNFIVLEGKGGKWHPLAD